MKKQTGKRPYTLIVLLLLSILFIIMMMTVLSPCGPKDDGTFMGCHQAGTVLRILAIASAGLSLLSLCMSGTGKDNKRLRLIVDVVIILLAVAMLCVPGHVVHLCMMPEMRCRAVMKPGATVFAILFIAAACGDIIFGKKD